MQWLVKVWLFLYCWSRGRPSLMNSPPPAYPMSLSGYILRCWHPLNFLPISEQCILLWVFLFSFSDFVNGGGGDLYTHVSRRGSLCESCVKFYVGELVLALQYLHKVSAHHLYWNSILVTACFITAFLWKWVNICRINFYSKIIFYTLKHTDKMMCCILNVSSSVTVWV